MSEKSNSIKCPNCQFEFPVEEALFSQAEERIKKEYDRKLQDQAAGFRQQQEQLKKDREEFEEKRKRENELFQVPECSNSLS